MPNLKAKAPEEYYLLIQAVTEKSRENEFVKKKEHLIYNYRQHQAKTSKLQSNILNQASLALRTLH